MRRKLGHVGALRADEHVHGLGRDRRHHRGDRGLGPESRRVEAVGARLGVGREPADRLREIRPADDETLGAAGEHDAGAARVDGRRAPRGRARRRGRTRTAAATDRRWNPRSRCPRRPCPWRARTLAPTAAGSTAKPPSKSAFTGTSTPAGDGAQVGQRLVQRDVVVAPAQRPREARARRRERGKAELREQAGAAEVPRVGQDEAAGLVQAAELAPAVVEGHVAKIQRKLSSGSRGRGVRPRRAAARRAFATRSRALASCLR